MAPTYEEAHRRSLQDMDGFWAEVAEAIRWEKRWDRILDKSRPPFYRWFTGGRLNTCDNVLDRHVEGGRADQLALIYDSPVTGAVVRFTYRQLLGEVARFAGALAGQGVASDWACCRIQAGHRNPARAWLRRADPRRGGKTGGPQPNRQHRHQAAVAARVPANAL